MFRPVRPRGIIDRMDGLSRRATWTVLAVSCLTFVVFDWFVPLVGTGPLYIPLIALAGWRLGVREAWGVVLVAALLNIVPIHGFDAGLSPFAATVRCLMRLGAYAFVAATVLGLRKVYDRERYAARHDALTGALNRASFEYHARSALQRISPDGPVMALALADIDGFKSVNDTCGHAEGDAVLRMFAQAGAAAIGEGDRFGRLGGDEFVMLLRASSVAAAASRVRTVHHRLRDGLRISGHPVDVSLGAVVVPPGTTLDWTMAVREADRLMYLAKRAGKGGYRIETSAEADASVTGVHACSRDAA